MAHDVFVSHSAKDKAVAAQVVAHLEDAGIRCWVAPRDVVPGADWGESIVDAIESSKVMVLIFSLNANNSSQIKREVERAADKNVYTIPVRIDDIEPTRSLEYFISNSQWMDAFPPPLEPHLDALARTVKAILARNVEPVSQLEPRREEQPRPTTYSPPPRSQTGLIIAGAVAALLVLAAVLGARYFTAPKGDKDQPLAAATAPAAQASPSPTFYAYEQKIPNQSANTAVRGPELGNDAPAVMQKNISKELVPESPNKFAMLPPNAPNKMAPVAIEDPVAVVRHHYESIDRRAPDEAWGLLSTGFKARRSREEFDRIFAETVSLKIGQIQTVSQTDNEAVVSVVLNDTDSAQRTHKWNRTVYLIKENGAWKIDRTTQTNADTPEKAAKKY